MVNVIITLVVFVVLAFLFWSTLAYWAGVYDRGKQRQGNL